MTAPITQKADKKTFHFPKNAKDGASEGGKTVAVAKKPAADKAAAPKKAAKPKRAVAPKKAAVAAKEAPVSAPAEVKVKRAKKEKVVRDSFTMPKSDYEKIAALKQKCLDAGVSVKKSELLHAGLLMLESAAPQRLLAAVSSVETVKTGRPAKG